MNIIVLNLPKDIKKGALAQLFMKYGKVSSCNLVMDKDTGQSKGFGFIKMLDDAEANAAIEGLHGSKVGGKKIRVKVSTPSDSDDSDTSDVKVG